MPEERDAHNSVAPVEEPEVLSPEVLPPEDAEAEPQRSTAERAFGPVVAGLIIDLVDFATFGPIGFFLGMILGGGVAWYITTLYGLSLRQRILWSAASGLYCTIPFTEFIPVGTMVGAFIRYREMKDEEARSRRP